MPSDNVREIWTFGREFFFVHDLIPSVVFTLSFANIATSIVVVVVVVVTAILRIIAPLNYSSMEEKIKHLLETISAFPFSLHKQNFSQAVFSSKEE